MGNLCACLCPCLLAPTTLPPQPLPEDRRRILAQSASERQAVHDAKGLKKPRLVKAKEKAKEKAREALGMASLGGGMRWQMG